MAAPGSEGGRRIRRGGAGWRLGQRGGAVWGRPATKQGRGENWGWMRFEFVLGRHGRDIYTGIRSPRSGDRR